MKKLIILCAIVLTTLLLITLVAGCQQQLQPPSSAPGDISLTATISGLEKGEEATLILSLSPGTDPAGKPIIKQTVRSDGERSLTVKITTSLKDGYYLLLLETPDKYFREPKGYLFQVYQSNIVNPTGRNVVFNLLPQPEGLWAEAFISLSAPPKAPPPPARLIFSWGLPDEAYYLPGETVEVKLLFKNVSSNNVTLEYLPEIRVAKHLSGGQALYSWTGRELMTELKPDETTTIDFTWDQKDTNGEQVPPGWYYITYKDPNVTSETVWKTGNVAMVLIQYPQGAMEKTIEVNESRTVNDITVTLERVELTSREMKVYAFVTQPDYPPTVRSSPFCSAATEYRIDGGAPVTLHRPNPNMDHFENGARFIWGGTTPKGTLDPVPSDAHELIFKINSMQVSASSDAPQRVEDQDDPQYTVEGPWEFTVSLGGDSNANQNVTFSQLISQANRYNGKTVTLEAFYFYGLFKISAIADSVGLSASNKAEVVPAGKFIWVKWDISQELQDQLYIQEGESPMHPEYFGKLRITGQFETGGKYGDPDTYQYQLTIISAEVLEWTPPEAGIASPSGNLTIKIEGFFGNPLKGAEVISSKQPEGQLKLSGFTDASGKVTFNDVEQGNYIFTVSLADYTQMDIRLAVTGGRTTSLAFGMARVGESPDDIVPAPGMGPQYRANIQAQGVTNPWPPILGTEVTIGTPPNAAQITYRDYIETEAGQTRNNMFITRLLGVDPADTTLEAIEVTLRGTDLPSGIIATQDWQYHGPTTWWSKTALKIEISPQVRPGEYTFNINVEINGKDYGTVPCTIEVIE